MADLVVGLPGYDPGPLSPAGGEVEIRSGATGALAAYWSSPESDDGLGRSVAAVGDANGDGWEDVAAGAPLTTLPGIGFGAGRVVVLGRNSQGPLLGLASIHTVDGVQAHERLGYDVAGAGDVNADGFSDVIAGAPRHDRYGPIVPYVDAGRAVVISGADGTTLYTFYGTAPGDYLGWSVAGAGDVNGDGFDDVVVGAPQYGVCGGSVPSPCGDPQGKGYARVYSGKTGLVLATLEGDFAGDELGFSVAGAGDFDGDGDPDVAAGAPGADVLGGPPFFLFGFDVGLARVYEGKSGTVLFSVYGSGDGFGSTVAGGRDLDGDGRDDLGVAQPGKGLDRLPEVRLYSGAGGSALIETVRSGVMSTFALLPDLDSDGRGEVAIGGPSAPVGYDLAKDDLTPAGSIGCVTVHGLANAPAAPDTLTVDDDGPADHDELWKAALAAPPDSILLVYPGDYRTTLVDRPLHVLGGGGSGRPAVEQLVAQGVETLTLARLELESGLVARDVPGRLLADDCRITGDYDAGPSPLGLVLTECGQALISRCFIESSSLVPVGYFGLGRPGAHVTDSRVWFSSCTLRGSDVVGHNDLGGDGIRAEDGSWVGLAACSVTGGDQNEGLLFPGPGAGIWLLDGSVAEVRGLAGSHLAAGDASPGYYNVSIFADSTSSAVWSGVTLDDPVGGDVVQASPPLPFTGTKGNEAPGGKVVLLLWGEAGAAAFTAVSTAPAVLAVPGYQGDVWIDPAAVLYVNAFVAAGPDQSVSADQWDLPPSPLLAGLQLHVQGGVLEPSGDVRMTNPRTLVVRF